MKSNKKHVVFLGTSSFPYGLAAVQRTILISKSLVEQNCEVTVICRKGSWNDNEHSNFNYKGIFEGIRYIYTSRSVFKSKSFIERNFQKIKGIFGEFSYLRDLKKENNLNIILVSSMKAIHLMRYLLYSSILGTPIVLNLVEMPTAMQERTKIGNKINDYLIGNWLIKFFDAALPISDKLMSYYKFISPLKPSIKLPILCDYAKFELSKEVVESPYYLYCGSINYMEVIEFILECYKNVKDGRVKMYMIVSGGGKQETQELQDKINIQFEDNPVKLFSNIPYSQLVHLYNHALALLIPLRPTVQDTSRFPHKIGEYLASANPVITTNVGEIKTYFQDGDTAFVAEKYEHGAFSKKMRLVLSKPKDAINIGLNGKKLGLREFDYKIHGLRLKSFFDKLL